MLPLFLIQINQNNRLTGDIVQHNNAEEFKNQLRVRHEHVNGYLKHFKCLQQKFRHNDEKHAACFGACIIITQLALESSEIGLVDAPPHVALVDAGFLQQFD